MSQCVAKNKSPVVCLGAWDKQTEVEVALPLQQTRTSAWGRVSVFLREGCEQEWHSGSLNRNCLQTFGQQSIWRLPAVRRGNQEFAAGWTSTGDWDWETPCWRSCSLSSRDFLSGKRPRTHHPWLDQTGATRGDTYTCRLPQSSTTSTWRSD